jgi:ribosomal-protein-serine acetyltransferase
MQAFDLGRNVGLRPLRLTDARDYYDCARKNFARLQPWFSWATDDFSLAGVEIELAEIERQRDPPQEFPYAFWAGDSFGGTIGLYKIDWKNRIARIGYWIDEALEGRGHVTAAARLLVDRAFGELQLNRIEIRCAPDNKPSRAVPMRLGFTEEGMHRQVLALQHGYQDLIMYAMLACDWLGP